MTIIISCADPCQARIKVGRLRSNLKPLFFSPAALPTAFPTLNPKKQARKGLSPLGRNGFGRPRAATPGLPVVKRISSLSVYTGGKTVRGTGGVR